MSGLSSVVVPAFGELIDQHRFLPCWALPSARSVDLVREESPGFISSINVTAWLDDRSHFDVDVWLTPVECPGGALEKLNVGFCIRIGSSSTLQVDFLEGCQSRLIHYLKAVPALLPVVAREMNTPQPLSRRWPIYLMERRIAAQVMDRAASGDSLAIRTIEKVHQAIARRRTIQSIDAACHELAESLLQTAALDAEAQMFYTTDPQMLQGGRNVRMLCNAISTQLYIHCLAELSRICPSGNLLKRSK